MCNATVPSPAVLFPKGNSVWSIVGSLSSLQREKHTRRREDKVRDRHPISAAEAAGDKELSTVLYLLYLTKYR